jgi:hypothetical protein
MMGEAFLLSLRFFFLNCLCILAARKIGSKVALEQCGSMADYEGSSSTPTIGRTAFCVSSNMSICEMDLPSFLLHDFSLHVCFVVSVTSTALLTSNSENSIVLQ